MSQKSRITPLSGFPEWLPEQRIVEQLARSDSTEAVVRELIDALHRVGKRGVAGDRKLGDIVFEPDPFIQRICDGWPQDAAFERADRLGLPHRLTLVLAAVVLAVGLVWLAGRARRGEPALGRAGAVERRLDFPLAVRGVQRDDDPARFPDAELGHEELRTIGHQHGYPVALSEAHEHAVVTGADRENFWALVESCLTDEKLPSPNSAKSTSKRTRWV